MLSAVKNPEKYKISSKKTIDPRLLKYYRTIIYVVYVRVYNKTVYSLLRIYA